MIGHEVEWRDVVGFEGLYAVSSMGDVRSNARTVMRSNGASQFVASRVLLAAVGRNGYRKVSLHRDGHGLPRTVHRLVAEAFHGPRPAPGFEVRHLDGDPLNNSASNLAWGTRAENSQDCLRHGNHFQVLKTHCVNGHAFNAENTYLRGTHRHCRPCQRARKQKMRQSRRAA